MHGQNGNGKGHQMEIRKANFMRKVVSIRDVHDLKIHYLCPWTLKCKKKI